MIGNKILLDTNILIYQLQEGEEGLSSLIEFNDILVSVISKIELLGYHSISAVEEKEIKHFLSTVELIQLNDQISDIAIDLRKRLEEIQNENARQHYCGYSNLLRCPTCDSR